MLSLLEQMDTQLCYLRVGARRDEGAQAYQWRDAGDLPYGPVLNTDDVWCAPLWMSGEPSFSWKGTEEICCVVEYDWDNQIWVWNDTPNEVSDALNPDTVGYIIEFEDAAAR